MRYLEREQVEALQRDGFLLVKNVFSEEEVRKVKELASNYCSINDYRKSPRGDAMSLDGMADFLMDDRFISIAKDILGDEVIYFGDSALHCKPNQRIFHKDSRSDFSDPSKSDYPIYRMGIFFQDHKDHSGGIKFRVGSHKKVILTPRFVVNLLKSGGKILLGQLSFKTLLNFGGIVNARSEIGDVVIWNLRTDHSGGAVLLKKFPDRALPPSKDEKVPSEEKLPEHPTRMAIFCAYAGPSEATETYTLDRVNNPAYIDHWKASNFDSPYIVKLAAERGVNLDLRGIKNCREELG
ncbi:MAG: hypothetical protein ABJP45_02675 [Cyclobacteriaceae bacterium]